MKKIIFFVPLLFCLFITGCKKNLSDLNNNPKQAVSVPSTALFANAEINLSDLMAHTNVNYNNFRLYVQYWTETTYTDETNYDLNGRSIPDRWWAVLYRDVIKDLTEASKVAATEVTLTPGQLKNRIAINEILITYSYYTLVTTFGNVPYTDALNIDNTQPKYDDAAAMYDALIARLDAALGKLTTAEEGYGSSDIILGGATDKWVKFGNSLKLRMAMVIADVNPSKAATLVTQASPKVVSSNSENLQIDYLSSPPNTNPVWEDLIQSGRHDFVAANTMIDSMKKYNDPRLPFYFKPYNGVYVGQPYGKGGGSFSDPSAIVSDPTNPYVYFSYAEMEFLKAEAIERGINVGGTAATHYNNAVEASIEEWGGTMADAAAYLAQPGVNYATAPGDWKEKIGVQSWLAFYNRGYEAWTQWRRLDYPKLKPGPEALSGIPVRLTYPVLEQNLNKANYEAAATAVGGDNVEKKLWFDKF
ncbi:MAG: hypothetical protein JWQ09_525 [Segetibacter sp.]|nr:hypothetical protein [Segetibacter sp.]